MMRCFVLLAAGLVLAAPALAEPVPPAQRPALLDLANALGEAHGIHKRCNTADGKWRAQMKDIVLREGDRSPFAGQLRMRFNTGYRDSQAKFASCTYDAVMADAVAATRVSDQLKRLKAPN